MSRKSPRHSGSVSSPRSSTFEGHLNGNSNKRRRKAAILPASLVWSIQPVDGQPLTNMEEVVVQVINTDGGPSQSNTIQVGLDIYYNGGYGMGNPGQLCSAEPVPTIQGRATFNGLQITTAGTYTLIAYTLPEMMINQYSPQSQPFVIGIPNGRA